MPPGKPLVSLEDYARYVKPFEKEYNAKLDPTRPCLIRLDGRAFNSLSACFDTKKDKFNEHYALAMRKAAIALAKEFNAWTTFTCSDEISIAYPHVVDPETGNRVGGPLMFGEKVEKLVSVSAGIVSSVFAIYLVRHCSDNERLMNFLAKHPIAFDARIFQPPTNEDLIISLRWRAMDYLRNSISALARQHFSSKQLTGKGTADRLKLLLTLDPPVYWKDLPDWAKFGVFCKRQLYPTTRVYNDKEKTVTRSRMVYCTTNIPADATSEDTAWLIARTVVHDDPNHDWVEAT